MFEEKLRGTGIKAKKDRMRKKRVWDMLVNQSASPCPRSARQHKKFGCKK